MAAHVGKATGEIDESVSERVEARAEKRLYIARRILFPSFADKKQTRAPHHREKPGGVIKHASNYTPLASTVPIPRFSARESCTRFRRFRLRSDTRERERREPGNFKLHSSLVQNVLLRAVE